MAASVLQAGPMVQMILARRGEGFTVEGSVIDSGLLSFNLSPIGGAGLRDILAADFQPMVRETLQNRLSGAKARFRLRL